MNLRNKKIAVGTNSTKSQILRKAEDLFSRYNYYAVSMDQIARLVNTTKAAIYYYFKSKRDLYLQILANSFGSLGDSLEIVLKREDAVERKLYKVIKTYIDFCLNQREIVSFSMQKMSKEDSVIIKFVNNLRSEIVDLLEPLVREVLTERRMKEGKKITAEIDTRLTTSLLTDMMDAFVVRQSSNKKDKLDSAKIADQIMALIFSKKGSSKKK